MKPLHLKVLWITDDMYIENTSQLILTKKHPFRSQKSIKFEIKINVRNGFTDHNSQTQKARKKTTK